MWPLTWGAAAARNLTARGERFDVVLGSDVTYVHEALEELAATLAELLRSSPARAPEGERARARPPAVPRVILAHEHRARRRDFGRGLPRWDAHDPAIGALRAVAARHGLALRLLAAERPVGEVRGRWRRWTADLSIVEVLAATAGADEDGERQRGE